MTTDTSKITGAADDLSDKLTKGGGAAKTLGAEIANAIKSLDDRVVALESGSTQPPIEPPPVIEPPPTGGGSTDGKITDFPAGSAMNNTRFKIEDVVVEAANGNKSWSLIKIDDYTLEASVRAGDKWQYDDNSCNRSEIGWTVTFSEGQQTTMTEKITVLPGPGNTGSWCDLAQIHSTVSSPPSPFVFGLTNTDKLQVILQSPQGNNYIWTDSNKVTRGREYIIKAVITMRASGGGRVEAWLDGNQIVNFTGAVGANNSQYYWKVGAYRGAAPETLTVRHKNIHITTG